MLEIILIVLGLLLLAVSMIANIINLDKLSLWTSGISVALLVVAWLIGT